MMRHAIAWKFCLFASAASNLHLYSTVLSACSYRPCMSSPHHLVPQHEHMGRNISRSSSKHVHERATFHYLLGKCTLVHLYYPNNAVITQLTGTHQGEDGRRCVVAVCIAWYLYIGAHKISIARKHV